MPTGEIHNGKPAVPQKDITVVPKTAVIGTRGPGTPVMRAKFRDRLPDENGDPQFLDGAVGLARRG